MRHVNFNVDFNAAVTPVMWSYGMVSQQADCILFFFFSLFVALLLPYLHMSLVLDVCWKSLGDTATKQSPYKDDA